MCAPAKFTCFRCRPPKNRVPDNPSVCFAGKWDERSRTAMPSGFNYSSEVQFFRTLRAAFSPLMFHSLA